MNEKPNFIAWRFYLVLLVILLLSFGLLIRIYDLTILKQVFLRHQGDERVLRTVTTPGFRGMITDRNGFPLAVSTPVFSVWIQPKEFHPQAEAISKLSQLVGLSVNDIHNLAEFGLKHKKYFQYVKRALPPEIGNKIKRLKIPGLYLQQEYRRFYPEGEVMAHVIGFTNIDDSGQEGLELAYNSALQGEAGRKLVVKDRLGRVIADVQNLRDERLGQDLVLSIDRRIQYLAYRELLKGVNENLARSGSAVVLDVTTGEILAMANVPSFNPNDRHMAKRDSIRNRAVTDTFEPGSTIKAFTVATALESGKYTPSSMIDTRPGWMRVGHNIVRDEHNKGLISLMQILQYSSNVGAAKLVLSLAQDQLWNMLTRVGFGESTGIDFPGEQSGVLIRHNPWGAFMLATLSFGYGLSTTTLQLARAYSVLANDGVKLPLSLLKVDKPVAGENVLDPKVAHSMLLLLESVFAQGGTASSISVPGYRVAAKTGTAKKVGIGGYEKHHYTSSFIGVAPLTRPRIVVAIVMHDPQGKEYYGGLVSGPVFQKVMEGSLRILSVAPDAKA